MWNEGDGVVMGGEVEGCENEWMEMIKLLSGNKVSRWHLYNLITLGGVATAELLDSGICVKY